MQVRLESVGHRFGDGPWLFRDVTTRFTAGNVYALTGPSGSGKSTLLSVIAGILGPRTGSIAYDGIERINWVFQNPLGAPRRTAGDHVIQPILATGVSVRDAELQAVTIMARFGLEGLVDREFRHLSGGEAQRLMLARSLASRPDLLLIDEPTAQLDRETAAQVNVAIGAAATPDTVIVVATHDQHTREACTAQLDLGTPRGVGR